MKKLSVFSGSRWPLRRKLFGYMLALAALLILALFMGLALFGQYESTEQRTFSTLDMQMEVFEKDITQHFDSLAAAGIRLSEDLGKQLDDVLSPQNLTVQDLSGDSQGIHQVQTLLMEPLRQMLLQESCSGTFVILDASVNPDLPDAEHSRTGIYLQINGYEKEQPQNYDLLLYRGLAQTGREHDIMPHRKWRLEFRTDAFPNYQEAASLAGKPAEEAYFFTDLVILPGTSEQVMLLAVPVTGADGRFYGICGLEVSASYFMTVHAQPTKLNHLSCLLAPGEASGTSIAAGSGLACGTLEGYHRTFHDDLTVKDSGDGLAVLSSQVSGSHIGITRSIRLSPNNPDYTLAVMVPEMDFDKEANRSLLKNMVLFLLLLFFTVSCCLSFSRRFIGPVLRELERLRLEYEQTRKKFETAQTEISRLAYSRKTEVDPDAFRQFAESIHTLTPTERRIFDYYVAGRTVKEVITLAGIKESTLRYHNQNIYSKLGVNSLKQLLRYAALLQQETGSFDE